MTAEASPLPLAGDAVVPTEANAKVPSAGDEPDGVVDDATAPGALSIPAPGFDLRSRVAVTGSTAAPAIGTTESTGRVTEERTCPAVRVTEPAAGTERVAESTERVTGERACPAARVTVPSAGLVTLSALLRTELVAAPTVDVAADVAEVAVPLTLPVAVRAVATVVAAA